MLLAESLPLSFGGGWLSRSPMYEHTIIALKFAERRGSLKQGMSVCQGEKVRGETCVARLIEQKEKNTAFQERESRFSERPQCMRNEGAKRSRAASIQRKQELFPGVREAHQQDVIAL